MLVVVDTNTVFSSLHMKGRPFEVFIVNKIVRLFEFVAPEFLFFEIGRRMDRLLAKKIAPHLKDVSFMALSFKMDCKILSGDKGLKKALPDRVITPSEALDMLLGKPA